MKYSEYSVVARIGGFTNFNSPLNVHTTLIVSRNVRYFELGLYVLVRSYIMLKYSRKQDRL